MTDESHFSQAGAVNHVLATYATDDVIAETVSDTHSFIQVLSIPATVCFHAPWRNVLRCRLVYDETQMNGLFMRDFNRLTVIVCGRIGAPPKKRLLKLCHNTMNLSADFN